MTDKPTSEGASLKWTKEAPTKPGWYWQRFANGEDVQAAHRYVRVVWIDWSKTDESVTQFLAVRGYVSGQGVGGSCNRGLVEWAGPIEPPA